MISITLEATPQRQQRLSKARSPVEVVVLDLGSPPRPGSPRATARIHRILGQVWRKGEACVRASWADGSIHIVPVECVDPSMLLKWRADGMR